MSGRYPGHRTGGQSVQEPVVPECVVIMERISVVIITLASTSESIHTDETCIFHLSPILTL